jgi:hypothetical protein
MHKKSKKEQKKSVDNFYLITHYMMLKMCFLDISGPSESRKKKAKA